MIVIPDLTAMRKAAAFVEALAEVEARFQMKLDLPSEGIAFGANVGSYRPYSVVRPNPNSPTLTIALKETTS